MKDTQKQREDEGLLIIICNLPVSPLKLLAATTGAMLVELTKVTRENLRNVEGSLWALWATAQQINARQKVELSIRCVFSTINMRWNDDSSSICSEGLKSKSYSYYLNI